jgi:hypothetical protein
MSKVYLKVNMRVIVDTDLSSVDDIMENIDFYAEGNTEEVEVLDHEVDNFYIEDSK